MNYYSEEEEVDVMDGFRLDSDEEEDKEETSDFGSGDDDDSDDPDNRYH